ncbi:ty3-gypsy retrotransposon protein [Cucumis melo var. makuwa]|uniref:Ty3-gypsy retrotransposon protein n=1 Tax=Cucumis melo var. makuwa TaxID=1194695 RepID=A0A5D3C5P7_CUCMM|nr:ty3-gypsy retrotransposon protein [Cucumis melo var. makuwa]
MHTCETFKSGQTPAVKASDKRKNMVQESQSQQQSTSVASLSIQQLYDMIANSIRAEYGGSSHTSFMYSKLYTKRINHLRMSLRSNLQNSNSSIEWATLSNTSPILSKHARIRDQDETN